MNKQKHNKNANRRLSRTVGVKWANRVGITEMSFRTRAFLRRNFPAQQRENGENPPPRFWFILFAIFLFLSFFVVVFMGASRLVCVHKVYTLMQSLQISPQPHIPASTSTFSGDVVVTRIDLFMFIKWKLAQGAPDEATPHF